MLYMTAITGKKQNKATYTTSLAPPSDPLNPGHNGYNYILNHIYNLGYNLPTPLLLEVIIKSTILKLAMVPSTSLIKVRKGVNLEFPAN